LLLPAVMAELGQLPESRQAFFGMLEAVVGPVQLLLGRRQRELALPEGRAGVGRSLAEQGSEFRLCREKPLDAAWRVVDGEIGVGLSSESVEHDLLGAALIGWHTAEVHFGDSGDVPGVGRLAGAALADIAREPFQGRRSEEV